MESKVNYTLVGLLVILLLAATGGIIAWLTAATDTKVYDLYRVYLTESVAGLNPNAPVKYLGVDVGQVISIELNPQNPEEVELTLKIERDTPIREDTVAILKTQGLTGLAYVELSGGSRHSPPLKAKPDEALPVIPAGPSLLARLDNAFNTAFTTFNDLSAKFDKLLSDDNRTAVSQTLSHLDTLSATVANRSESIDRILANLETTTAIITTRTDSIGKSLDNLSLTLQNSARFSADLAPILGRLATGLAAVQEAAQTITRTGKGLDTTVQQSRQDLQRIASNTIPQVNRLLYELGQLAEVMQRFSQELERNPRMLIFGKQSGRLGPGE
jgi:phospholipid/cholesterol/gamma-HCH transport system substrate-binding protein